METRIINLFGGAGAGKSTLASSIFSELKKKGIETELVTEYAKELIWEGNSPILQDQIKIFGEQNHRQVRLLGKVDVVVTDSPILLGILYDKTDNDYLHNLILHTFLGYNNLNYFVTRKHAYTQKGRLQTHEEAIQKDREILDLLQKYEIPFHFIGFRNIIKDVLEELDVESKGTMGGQQF